MQLENILELQKPTVLIVSGPETRSKVDPTLDPVAKFIDFTYSTEESLKEIILTEDPAMIICNLMLEDEQKRNNIINTIYNVEEGIGKKISKMMYMNRGESSEKLRMFSAADFLSKSLPKLEQISKDTMCDQEGEIYMHTESIAIGISNYLSGASKDKNKIEYDFMIAFDVLLSHITMHQEGIPEGIAGYGIAIKKAYELIFRESILDVFQDYKTDQKLIDRSLKLTHNYSDKLEYSITGKPSKSRVIFLVEDGVNFIIDDYHLPELKYIRNEEGQVLNSLITNSQNNKIMWYDLDRVRSQFERSLAVVTVKDKGINTLDLKEKIRNGIEFYGAHKHGLKQNMN